MKRGLVISFLWNERILITLINKSEQYLYEGRMLALETQLFDTAVNKLNRIQTES